MYEATEPALFLMIPSLLIFENRSTPTLCCMVANATNTVSTMTNVPSSNSPKSNAPMEMRFAGNPWIFNMIIANKKDKGITEATMTVDFQLYKNTKTINETNRIPSTIFFETVCTVLLTNLVRSTTVSIYTPSGKTSSFNSVIFFFNRSITADGYSPRNMMTIPSSKTSYSLYPTCPERSLLETTTSATFLINIVADPFNFTVMFSISSILSNSPTPRT